MDFKNFVFRINGNLWEIMEKDKKTLLDAYNSEHDADCTFVFGITKYPEHQIWICKDMCEEQKIHTLKHELTHCYIWNYGLYNVPNFNEEMVCDFVASINDFINEVIEEFKKELGEKDE